MRAGLRLALDAKVSGLVEGCLDAQDAALFVVHFDRVGLEGVFDTNPFGALFQIAGHFSFKVAPYVSRRRHAMAPKTHDVRTGKTGDGVTHQRRINARQWLGTFEQHIRCVFALLGCPVAAQSQRPADHRSQGGGSAEGSDPIALANPDRVACPSTVELP